MTSHLLSIDGWAFHRTTRPKKIAARLLMLCSCIFSVTMVHAQVHPPITSSGLNTKVDLSAAPPAGTVQYDITGGTRPGGGVNLFHSFGDFNVPTNNIANFLNDSGLATSNILGRVTGGNMSNIFGTIQTTGFGNANLFLMNPTGFLFGPNATVNVGGMVAFTTADYLRLADGVRFNAIPDAVADALFSAAPVAAFGFLGSNPGAITVQGSQFAVAEGTGISLVGGNITVQSGTLDDGTVQPAKLTAPGGQINLASVASPGEILSSNLQLGANVNGESFTSLGSITVSQDARIDTATATGGTIAIRGGQLTIRDGATITAAASSNPSAPAGSVTINGTGVQMTGSDVMINGTNVSVTGSQVTAANLDGSGGTITITAGNADHPGNVTVAQNALLDASGTKGGSISIRGNQLVVDNATISADTVNSNGAPVAININITGDMSIATVDIPALTARTTGSGNAGEIRIVSANMDVTATTLNGFIVSAIDTHTSGSGKGGDINITTGDLRVEGDPFGLTFFTDSTTTSKGPGGNVTITATNMVLDNALIYTGDTGLNFPDLSTGPAGSISIKADSLTSTFSGFSTFSPAGAANDITITARDMHFESSLINADGFGRAGGITLNAGRLVAANTQVESETLGLGSAGGITINGQVIELTTGSTLATTTLGNGNAGDIHVTGTDSVTLSGNLFGARPTGIFSGSGLSNSGNFLRTTGRFGDAGTIFITTPKLDISGGARINTVTTTDGRGGNVSIAADTISISGQLSIPPTEALFGTQVAGGIFTSTSGSTLCSAPCGNAGNVSISTGSLALGNGAQIDSGTSSTGLGGNITISAANTIALSGTLSDGTPVGVFSQSIGTDPGSGPGGNIALTAGQSVTISDGASVSAASRFGPGNTGNIQINAGNLFEMTNHSSVTTEADHASGGAIKISTTPNGTVQLTDSTISASVRDGTGGGGSVNIDPQFVILLNSQIKAQAVEGPGGNISITTNFLLTDANSEISASSQFGTNGTVTIQSPNAPISGQIQPLGKTPLIATSLLNQHCASLAGGEFSSFTVAGRDSLPAEPGSWLTSPLALASPGFSASTVTMGGAQTRFVDPADETPVLSLRQIAPAGFLTQAFAVDWSTSCQS